MPNMDGTGPQRKGSKTGRGLGLCKKNISNDDSAGSGRGLGKHRKSGGGAGRKRQQQGSQK